MIDFQCTPVFEKNYDSTKRIVINRGGTRSSKTYSICEMLALWLLTGQLTVNQKIKRGWASVVRKTFPALRATALRDFEGILKDYGLYHYVHHNKTEHTFTYKGRTVEFFSTDDQQKVRGRKRNILFCNEGNELDYEDFRQLLFRTEDKVFIDFNPDDPDVWINTELEEKRQYKKGDVEVIVSSYLDNTFLSQPLVEEIEYLRETDAQYWQIFGLGEYGKITGLIFPNWQKIKKFPEELDYVHGLDFGYTNDPTAIPRIALHNKKIYIDEILYETNLTNPDIAERFVLNGGSLNDIIYADSAEPKSIQELNNLELNVLPAKKGPDSIKAGISFLKNYEVFVTESSVNIWKEQRKYKWLVNKEGQTLNKPIDKFNHMMDAIRYGTLSHYAGVKDPFY